MNDRAAESKDRESVAPNRGRKRGLRIWQLAEVSTVTVRAVGVQAMPDFQRAGTKARNDRESVRPNDHDAFFAVNDLLCAYERIRCCYAVWIETLPEKYILS